MPPTSYTIFLCSLPACRFRFPLYEGETWRGVCPRCGGPVTAALHLPLAADSTSTQPAAPARMPVAGLLDNVRSTFNVGSIFRTADGAALESVALCGITPTPEHPKVAKTALGAQTAVPWQYHPNALDAARALDQAGFALWAIENTPSAQSLFEAQPFPGKPVALVVGNEISGVDPDLLAVCEKTFWIPMGGVKGSLNVAIAFSIAAYHLRYLWQYAKAG